MRERIGLVTVVVRIKYGGAAHRFFRYCAVVVVNIPSLCVTGESCVTSRKHYLFSCSAEKTDDVSSLQ